MLAIRDMIVEYWALIVAIVLIVWLLWLIYRYRGDIRFFLKSVWYRLPIVGKTRRLAKELGYDDSGWFRSERALCSDFHTDLKAIAVDPDLYDRAKRYLGKAQELGRNQLSIFFWLLICLIVFFEALVFSYVLAGWTLPGASEALQIQGALAIAFLISVILVAMTHFTGNEIHKRSLVKKARVWWLNDNSEDRPSPLGSATSRVSLEHDYEDDDEKNYVQILNRVDHNAQATPGFPWIGFATLVVIVLVATGATYVRIATQEQLLMAESTMKREAASGFSFPTLGDTPKALTDSQARADKKLLEDIAQTKRRGGRVTFAVLATIFVFIQILSVIIGFRRGFAGKESGDARRIIGNFKSRREYEIWFERNREHIIRIAQGHLTRLQARLQKYAAEFGIDKDLREVLDKSADRTFLRYVDGERAEDLERDRRWTEEEEVRGERKRAAYDKRRSYEGDKMASQRAKQTTREGINAGASAETREDMDGTYPGQT